MGQTVQFGHFLGLILFGLGRDLVSESSQSLFLRLTGSREHQFSSANVNTEKCLHISPWQQLTRGPQRTHQHLQWYPYLPTWQCRCSDTGIAAGV